MEVTQLYIFVLTVFFLSSSESADKFVCQKQEDGQNLEIDDEQSVKSLELRVAELEKRNSQSSGGQTIKALEDRIVELEEQLRFINITPPGLVQLQYTTLPKDCAQLYKQGQRYSSVYRVSPDGQCPFDVYCEMTGGGWTVIQRRQKGDVEFSQRWDNYVTGFGDLHEDFWLGLDKIHRLTKGGSDIVFKLGHYRSRNKDSWAYYHGFVVHDVTSGYKMNVDTFGYKGNIEELFSYSDGAKFSTFDRDQDQFSSSCSEQMGGYGGWWYNSCYRLGNLNGVFGSKEEGGVSYWNKNDRYVKTTRIAVKPMYEDC